MKWSVSMRVSIQILVAMMAAALSSPAGAEVYRCHIGKPSYCFKYGGHLCEMWNNAPNKPAACAKWSSACIDCHNEIPTCLGHVRPPSNSSQCKTCNAKWQSCMRKIDRRYWPNRQSRSSN